MKKIKKILSIVTFVFLFVFVLVSCNENNTVIPGNASSNNTTTNTVVPTKTSTTTVSPTTSTEAKLSDDEVKNNFNNYVKTFSLSKATLNNLISKAVNSGSDVDISSLLDKVSIPNSNATVKSYKNDNVVDSYSAYLWQEEKVIYLGYNDNLNSESTVTSAKIDLAALTTFFNSLKGSIVISPDEDIDYVGLILSQLNVPKDLDIDAILALFKFTGDDFTYSDGYFTLKMEKVVSIIQQITLMDKETVEATIANVGKFDFKLGYDGKNFTGFSFEFIPNLYENCSGYVKVSLTLNYNFGVVTGGEFEVGVKSVENNVTVYDISLKASVNLLGVSVDAKVVYNKYENYKINFNATLNANKDGLNLSVNGTVSVANNKSEVESVVTYTDYKVEAALSLNESKLEFVLKINDHKFADINLVLNKYVVVSGTIILDANGLIPEEDLDIDKYVVEYTTNNVVIPDSYKNTKDNALDLSALLIDKISSIIGGSKENVDELA